MKSQHYSFDKEELIESIKNMTGYKIRNQNNLHFLTFTVVGWIDIFTRTRFKDVIINSLEYCSRHKGLNVYAFVIMSNHLHLILSADEGYQLSNIIRDFKKYTSKKILSSLIQGRNESRSEWLLKMFKYFAKYNSSNKKFQLWRKDNRPIELVSPKWINQKLLYIHENPVKARIVENAEDYIYSSASWYYRGTGIMEVEILDFSNTIGYIDM